MAEAAPQKDNFHIFSAHIDKFGLRGFEDVVNAHINTWGNTANGLYQFHQTNIDSLTQTSLSYLHDDFTTQLEDLRQRTAEHRATFQNILSGEKSNSTKCCDINVHGPKQLKVDGLFSLLAHLPDDAQDQGLKILSHAGYAVYQIMHDTAFFEEDLLKTILPERETIQTIREKDIIPPLTQNVKYHKQVAADWASLQQRATATLQQKPPAPAHNL